MGTTYRATVQRDGSFWLIKVDGVGVTQARHLRELDAMTTDLITVMTGAEPAEVEIDFDIIDWPRPGARGTSSGPKDFRGARGGHQRTSWWAR